MGENEMKEILIFLSAGAFVYLGLGVQAKCSGWVYWGLVGAALVFGYLLRR